MQTAKWERDDRIIMVTSFREGTVVDAELTTRPVVGVDWMVDTASVDKKQHHPQG
jgi:hypothetical protein